jgi:hypothetical protein
VKGFTFLLLRVPAKRLIDSHYATRSLSERLGLSKTGPPVYFWCQLKLKVTKHLPTFSMKYLICFPYNCFRANLSREPVRKRTPLPLAKMALRRILTPMLRRWSCLKRSTFAHLRYKEARFFQSTASTHSILSMFQTKPVVVQTSNFGGAQGTSFNDNEAGP